MSDLHQIRLPNFELQKQLGQGGMGSVYRALDINLQRTVAIKLLHPELAEKEEFRQRFLQEARAAANLDHQNIVRIYTFHADAEYLYLVMEYVEEGSLRDLMDVLYDRRQQMNMAEALLMVQQVASALDYAHQRGMVHRDVKPDNVLTKSVAGFGGSAKTALLTDFGLAKLLVGHNLVKTQMNKPLGTLPYMAPEQFQGTVDGRTDLYALGIMMFELLVGRLPFMPNTPHEAISMHMNQEPPRPSQIRPDLPPYVEQIILKALSKSPDHRFQTGREIIEAIQRAGSAPYGQGAGGLKTTADPEIESTRQKLKIDPGLVLPPPPPQPRQAAEDRIVVERDGYASVVIPVKQTQLIIGRDPNRDIPLPGQRVSRNHARIDRGADGQYTVTDLGSTNGTFLEGARLLPNVAEKWRTNQILDVGEYQLVLQRAGVDF